MSVNDLAQFGETWTDASEASFYGAVVVARWPTNLLNVALRQIDAEILTGKDTHPVFFFVGEQRLGAGFFGGRRIGSPVNYDELLVVIPEIKSKSCEYRVAYLSVAYTDFFPALAIGRMSYGYNKISARLGWKGTSYLLSSADGLRLRAELTSDHSVDVSRTQEKIRKFASENIVGQFAGGPIVLSRWSFNFDDTDAKGAFAQFTSMPALLGRKTWSARGILVNDMRWRLLLPKSLGVGIQRS